MMPAEPSAMMNSAMMDSTMMDSAMNFEHVMNTDREGPKHDS